jgi:hypothetical protein
MSAPELLLDLAIEPGRWPDGELLDVRLVATFENRSAGALELYPDVARFSVESGWGSPTWHLEGPTAKLRELRHQYGPPGMPPTGAYYAPHRKRLKPGRREKHVVAACFIPASRLRPEHLSPATLDPEGMDGWAAPPPGTSVLVLGRSRAELLAEQSRRPDFLRPSVLMLIGPGSLDLRLRYDQRPWTGFEPAHTVAAEGAATVVVG